MASKLQKQAKIKKIVKSLKPYKPKKVILFGSYAWGKPTKDSDFDFLIVKQTKDKRYYQLLLRRAIFGKGIPVDLLIYTPKEIEKRLKLNDFFIKNIVQKGEIVYEKK